MIIKLRTLLVAHLTLLRSELAAITREAIGVLLGLTVAVSLLVIALLIGAGLLLVGGSLLLVGSPLPGFVALFGLPLLGALLLLLRALHLPGRPGRVVLFVGIALGLVSSLLLDAGTALAPAESLALALGIGLLGALFAGLLALRRFDRQAFAARFYPSASERELWATLDRLGVDR